MSRIELDTLSHIAVLARLALSDDEITALVAYVRKFGPKE